MKVTIVPIVIGALSTIKKGIIKRPGRLGSWRTDRVYPNDSIAENSQNPETSPGDFAVTHSSEKLSANADVKNSDE